MNIRPNHSHRIGTRRTLVAASLVAIGLGLSACGGSDSPQVLADHDTKPTVATSESTEPTLVLPTTIPPGTTSPSSAPTTAAQAGGNGLEGVAASTVQVIAQGTFVDPEFGAYEAAGSGSGFVIDPSGLAVTNNHVSECPDLAVIDIDGDALPALSWYDGEVTPGLEVYAAGFPLGNPEYTLTSGIVSKANAQGETGWASVDHVIEHDASIQKGNSGGPLVTADGEVVGINYATWTMSNTDQFTAIESGDAQAIIDQLAAGNDVDSLGINGQIVANEDGTLTGLWVSGVASGSPADEIGIQAGDIIDRIEGVTVGRDGTMADYCDVMRTHQPGDVLSVEVVRQSTGEILEGQFNGDYLMTTFSFADEFQDEAADGADYTAYTDVTDDTGMLTVSVPVEWYDIDGASIDLGGVSSTSLIASTDVAAFQSNWDVPGVQFVASEALIGYTADELLDLASTDECVSEGRVDYDDGLWYGRYESFTNCGGTGATSIVVAAFDDEGTYGVLVAVQVVTDADLVALDEILNSFDIFVA
ncbi:MAG: trypsin-like peptidase domain-containing protein [Actinobacteria bacterium]|nr:trypsin-like peptidase domain-containing protein [Actinomycetota bacterium]